MAIPKDTIKVPKHLGIAYLKNLQNNFYCALLQVKVMLFLRSTWHKYIFSITVCAKHNSYHNLFYLLNNWNTKASHPAIKDSPSYYVSLR